MSFLTKISSLLGKINGKVVEYTGFTLGSASASLDMVKGFHGHAAGIGAALTVYCLARKYPQYFNWLKSFAEPTTWPAYVSLGVAAMFGAHLGGVLGLFTVGSMLMMNDGRTFDSLY